MELPKEYLQYLAEILSPFCEDSSEWSLKDAERMAGKANRVAHVVPNARPFVPAVYAALVATKNDISNGKTQDAWTNNCDE